MEFPFAYTRSRKLDKSTVEITISSADKNDTLALARQGLTWHDSNSIKQLVKCNTLSSLATDFKGIRLGKMVKIIKFLFFTQKVSSGMGHYVPNF